MGWPTFHEPHSKTETKLDTLLRKLRKLDRPISEVVFAGKTLARE